MVNVCLSINPKGERTLEISGFISDFVADDFPDLIDALAERFGITEVLPAKTIDPRAESNFKYMNPGERCPKCHQGFMQIEQTLNQRTKQSYDHLVCTKGCGFTAYISKFAPKNGSHRPISNSLTIS